MNDIKFYETNFCMILAGHSLFSPQIGRLQVKQRDKVGHSIKWIISLGKCLYLFHILLMSFTEFGALEIILGTLIAVPSVCFAS